MGLCTCLCTSMCAKRHSGPSLASPQEYNEWLPYRHDASLLPMKEDLAFWLNTMLGETLLLELRTLVLMDRLDNGVLLCQLAQLLQEKMLHAINDKPTEAAYTVSGHSFLLHLCVCIGVDQAYLFESEDLVLQRQPREVCLCLMELGRIVARYGVEPPGLVKLERETEIEREEAGGLSPSPPSPLSFFPPTSLYLPSQKIIENPPCCCPTKFLVEKQPKGCYRVGDKVLYIRMLNERHVMVRVGGGWESFVSYLQKHDPCRGGAGLAARSVVRVCRDNMTPPRLTISPDSYMVVGAHYRGKK
uniref:Growth arrest-specific 2b n=1 Tax=Monopterus albus TaxID=43700 RepID=A0A3Q3JZP8_MONAL